MSFLEIHSKTAFEQYVEDIKKHPMYRQSGKSGILLTSIVPENAIPSGMWLTGNEQTHFGSDAIFQKVSGVLERSFRKRAGVPEFVQVTHEALDEALAAFAWCRDEAEDAWKKGTFDHYNVQTLLRLKNVPDLYDYYFVFIE